MTRPHEGSGEAAAPGLAIQRQSSTNSEPIFAGQSPFQEPGSCPKPDPLGGCPNLVGWVMVNRATGQVVPARCARNKCPHCLGLNAFRRSRAVAAAQPSRVILLTQAADTEDPDPWPTVRNRVNRTREYLKRDGIDPGYWAYFVERGDDTGMVHVHVAQHGPAKVHKEALQEAAHMAGCGWSSVNAMRQRKGFAHYVGKGFARYVGKGFTAEDAAENLRLNGGRLGHFSRGFFTDNGQPIGVKAAEKIALASEDDTPGDWIFMRESMVAA